MNILYLHGFRTNKKILNLQTAKLRMILPEHNHILINALYKANEPPEDPNIQKYFDPPFYEHCQVQYLTNKNENNQNQYLNNDNVKYFGIKDTIKYLSKIIEDNNINAIVGFSQGSYIGAILTSYYEIDFFISVCGMPLKDKKFPIDFNTKSLHIVGANDNWNSAGILFANQFYNSKLMTHSGGHHFPREKEIYDKIKKWISNDI